VQVESILDRMRGRRPGERAKVLLNLAAMCREAPDTAEDRNYLDYLRRALAFLGEAAMSEGTHPDTARAYLAEALNLATSTAVDFPLTHLLATYLQIPPAPGGLQSPTTGKVLVRTVLERLEGDAVAWRNIENDFPYYSAISRHAASVLAKVLKIKQWQLRNFLETLEDLESKRDAEVRRLQRERNTLDSLKDQAYTGPEAFRNAATQLSALVATTRFETDRSRLKTLPILQKRLPRTGWSGTI
jgi:hypothetical protein